MRTRKDSDEQTLQSMHKSTVSALKGRLSVSRPAGKEISKRMSTASEVNLTDLSPDSSSLGILHATSMPALSCANCLQHRNEIGELRSEISSLRKQLKATKEALESHQKSEKVLRERLANQAQKQICLSDKFEDVNLGSNRPTALIQQYGILYSQTRVDALDSLDTIPQLSDLDNLKSKLLFSVIVLSFRACKQKLQHLKDKVIESLGGKSGKMTSDRRSAQQFLEENITAFLRKTLDTYDIATLTKEVQAQIFATLYDYPCLNQCTKLRIYITECVRVAWRLCIQSPVCILEFESKEFNNSRHSRFHTSDGDSTHIRSYIWPALIDVKTGTCLQKGVVLT